MTKLTFSTTINAPKDLVWRTLLEDETYRKWTSAFQEGSYAVTDWKPGSTNNTSKRPGRRRWRR